jgi:chemotaxis protein methyltransferase CheR
VLQVARELVRDQLGLEFPARRDADLARALGDEPEALVHALREEPRTAPTWRMLIAELTVQESYFFRDRALFDALAQHVLPQLIAQRRASGDLRLSIWSAGCAEGQEPFSIAMLLDRMLPDRAAWEVTILGTDVNQDALDAARVGIYSDWALRDLPAWARVHFRRGGARRNALADRIRRMVAFAPLNLATDAYPVARDLIVCRNVLMYLTDDARKVAVRRFGASLSDVGRLALSPLDSNAQIEGELLQPMDAAGVRLLARRRAPVPVAEAPAEPLPPAREPDPVPPALARARAAADEGRADAAVELCLQALRDDPLDAEAHLLMAAIEEERGELAAAIAAVRRAVYTAPDSPTAHFRLGTLLLRAGDEAAARRSLATAAELFGEHAPAPLLAKVAS